MLEMVENLNVTGLIISAAITTLVGILLHRFVKFTKETAAHRKAINAATLASLRHNIVETHRDYKKCGKINKYALDALEEQYAAYVELGGNGFIQKVMEEIRALPIE